MALIFDDAYIIQGNVTVADKAEFDDLIDQLPKDWSGELRKGHNGSRYVDPLTAPHKPTKCNICDKTLIQKLMGGHIAQHEGKRY